MSELFLDRNKTHIITDKDVKLEIMFDAGMKSWYVKYKSMHMKPQYHGSYFSKYYPNELELIEAFPFIKDYMKTQKFNEEMMDIINDNN